MLDQKMNVGIFNRPWISQCYTNILRYIYILFNCIQHKHVHIYARSDELARLWVTLFPRYNLYLTSLVPRRNIFHFAIIVRRPQFLLNDNETIQNDDCIRGRNYRGLSDQLQPMHVTRLICECVFTLAYVLQPFFFLKL